MLSTDMRTQSMKKTYSDKKATKNLKVCISTFPLASTSQNNGQAYQEKKKKDLKIQFLQAYPFFNSIFRQCS